MSPNDVKAIKLLAQILEKPERNWNPIALDYQAEEVREKFGLDIDTRPSSGQYKSKVLLVKHGGNVIDEFSGDFPRNQAIVYAACTLREPQWREKPLFGIDFRFDASRYEDAAGPEKQ